MCANIPYKLYTKVDIDEKVERYKKDDRDLKVKSLIMNLGNFKIGIIFTLNFFGSSNTSHIDFFAMSQGLEAFTDTGYKSMWVDTNNMPTDDEIEEYITLQLKKENIKIGQAIQLSLF